MGLVHQLDHLGAMLGRLPQQFRGLAQLEARYAGIAQQVQEVEDALWGIFTLRWLGVAEGAQLDVLGRILRVDRGASDDTSYTNRLRAEVLLNRSSGEVETLIQVVRLLAPSVLNPLVTEPSPATMLVDVTAAVVADVASLLQALVRAKDGGVRLLLHTSSVAPSLTFTFNGAAGQGFNDGLLSSMQAG